MLLLHVILSMGAKIYVYLVRLNILKYQNDSDVQAHDVSIECTVHDVWWSKQRGCWPLFFSPFADICLVSRFIFYEA